MRRYKLLSFIVILIICTSCVTGIFELVRGRHNYVSKINGREELLNKKYKVRFKPDMARFISTKKVYYSHYENKEINYVNNSYLRFFDTGQFAYFSSIDNDVDVNNLVNASFVGYYIVDEDFLKLETPRGNFNSGNFRMILTYKLTDNKLYLVKPKHRDTEFEINDSIYVDVGVKPDW